MSQEAIAKGQSDFASARASEPPTFAALNAAAATVGRRERLARERVRESEGR